MKELRKTGLIDLVKKGTQNVADYTIEKTSTPQKRTGLTVERAVELSVADKSNTDIARSLTKKSFNKFTYTPEQVDGFKNLYTDCATRPLITKEEVRNATREQLQKALKKQRSSENGPFEPSPA